MKPQWVSVLLPLALPFLFTLGCTKSNDGVPPPAEKVEKAGSSATPSGCLSGLSSALAIAIRDLHVRTSCTRNGESGKFNWSYIYRSALTEGETYDTVEKCIDGLATHMNDHIPYLEISLTERCAKKIKMYNGERVVWAFEYGTQK
jgi:hypothetical protein